jgi:hypothetical protein
MIVGLFPCLIHAEAAIGLARKRSVRQDNEKPQLLPTYPIEANQDDAVHDVGGAVVNHPIYSMRKARDRACAGAIGNLDRHHTCSLGYAHSGPGCDAGEFSAVTVAVAV